MKGDFSRSTFDPTRHYSGVRMQQGRVQLDADWNEQADLARQRAETEALDTLGGCGGPLHHAAFAVTPFSAVPAGDLAKYLPPGDGKTAGDLLLGAGRYYVDGVLVEAERPVSYVWQPDLPGGWADTTGDGRRLTPGYHLLYLDVWERHVTALEDPRLRETALGGPDTATRTRTVWQVRALPLATGGVAPGCGDGTLPAASTGRLRARAEPDPGDPGPCELPPGAGYRGIENQLYRVEVHAAGTALDLAAADTGVAVTAADPVARTVTLASGVAGAYAPGDTVELYLTAAGSDAAAGFVAQVVTWSAGSKTLTLTGTFPAPQAADLPRLRKVVGAGASGATWKWSRDNGIVVSRILTLDPAERRVTVESLGVDDVLDFRAGQWAEITDDHHELNGLPGQLLQIERVDPTTRAVVFRTAPSALGSTDGVTPARTPKLRRWDGVGVVKTSANPDADVYATLEDGVQVRFDGGTYHTGDWWLVPARTATADAQSGSVEWPREGANPAALRPRGITHHYCRLAVVRRLDNAAGSVELVSDCRCLFAPLTAVPALHYVSGAGQEARPGISPTSGGRVPLGLPLVVGMANGACHAGAMVRFRRVEGKGAGTVSATTTDDGLAQVDIPIGANGLAECWWFVDPGNQHQLVEARLLLDGAPVHPPILFNASLSVAWEVAYRPGACAGMPGAVETVQEAIDWLCAHRGGGCELTVGPGGDFETLAQALANIPEKGSRCLCLLRGEHTVETALPVKAPGGAVKISGCGTGTKILLKAPLLVGPLASFILRDLDVEASGVDRPLRFEACDQVHFDNCSFLTVGSTHVVTVAQADRLRMTGCNVLSLAVAQGSPTTGGRVSGTGTPKAPGAATGKAETAALAGLQKVDLRAALRDLTKGVAQLGAAQRVDDMAGFLSEVVAILGHTGQRDAEARVARPRRRGTAETAFAPPATGITYGHFLALLDAQVFVNVEDCVVFGLVRLFGTGTGAPLDSGEQTAALKRALQEGRVQTSGSNVVVRGSAFLAIHLDPVLANATAQVPAFRNLALSDSEIFFPSQLLAAFVKLTSNQFQMPSGFALHVFGHHLGAVGNASLGVEVGIFYTTLRDPSTAANTLYFSPV
ncbi:MAG TPA: DUF6519 domain-containing protein [Longimicrobium sp.]|nr:DUF6519 domain-containing protein [Longimicrobium sp.]